MGWRMDDPGSFTGRVRRAAQELGIAQDGRLVEFSADLLSLEAGVRSQADRQKMHRTIEDLVKRGEIKRTSRRGVYLYVGKRLVEGVKKKQKREVMWRFLRMRNANGRAVTVGDLQEAAGVSSNYAEEWIQMLHKHGAIKPSKSGQGWWLVSDLGEAPGNDRKAEKLRELRARKRTQALAALNEVLILAERAKQAIVEMEEEDA